MLKKVLHYLKHPGDIKKRSFKNRNKAVIDNLINDLQLTDKELYNLFLRSIEKYTSGGGFKYHLNNQLFKLYDLHKKLIELSPNRILELGSGSTTTVILNYISNHNKNAEADCMEESEIWLHNTNSVINSLGLQMSDRFNLIHSEKILDTNTFPSASRYNFNYIKKYDFVIIDGPSTNAGETYSDKNYNTDFFKIAEYHLPETVLIDNRRSTFHKINETFGKFYDVNESFMWHSENKAYTSNDISFYTVMRLKQ